MRDNIARSAIADRRFWCLRVCVVACSSAAVLIATQPATAYEIAHELWGNVAVTQAYLTLSEVLGHLDMLLADGRACERESGGVVRFEAA